MALNIGMAVMFDYKNDTILIDGIRHQLDQLREWLLINHPVLCTNNFIKTIRVFKANKRTYDWLSIFEIAQDSGFLLEFKKAQK